MFISVIISTRNRCEYLRDALGSALNQSLSRECYEIIVVDNGSTDGTAAVVEEMNRECADRIRYFYEPSPGLHNSRHRGAKESQTDILAFADDDIIAGEDWLKALSGAFDAAEVAFVGGKILPRWEGDVPDWVYSFRAVNPYGWTIGSLSLLDFGDRRKDIPARYVFGCNLAIRKSVLYECGGFHPDSISRELIRYRGDGETGLAEKIKEKGYRSIYEPKATVYHRITSDRMTEDYFCRRAFNQGVSDSFTEIRLSGGIRRAAGRNGIGSSIRNFISFIRDTPVQRMVRTAYIEGKTFHRRSVEEDPELLRYVLKETYLYAEGTHVQP